MSSFAPILHKYCPDLGPYEEFYKFAHQNGELSTQEKETAALITKRLREISPDLDIRTDIGGHGLIAIYKNGAGPTVLLRADIDALPVREKTGLPYASTKTMPDVHGVVKPVMHACGHDMHFTALLAAAETLIAARSAWAGTIVFLFQPAEECALGAQNMVRDGLYDPQRHACPIPDVVLGQHVDPFLTGTMRVRKGPVMAAGDSYLVKIFGRGAHGSTPQFAIDPVVIASHVVVRLQTIVSREIPSTENAVVTVGSFHAGSAENVIPDEATLKLNIRSSSVHWRARILESVKRIIEAECLAGHCPRDPLIETISAFPLTINSDEATAAINKSFTAHFGANHDPDMEFMAGSEDVSRLATAVDKPYCFWFFGGQDKKTYEDAMQGKTSLPINHSPFYGPALQPTLTTGVHALVIAALTWVGK